MAKAGAGPVCACSLVHVQKRVIAQVRLLREAAIADVALERPGAVVDVHVALEIARRRERLRAEGALVWLLLLIEWGRGWKRRKGVRLVRKNRD